MSEDTAKAFDIINDRRVHVVEDKQLYKISDTFEVFSFALPHDCEGTRGFIVKDKSLYEHNPKYFRDKCLPEYLLFVPDTMYIEQRFALSFNIIALEANFDEAILETRVNTGDINEELAKRIRQSHQSKQACFEYIEKFCDISKCREIHLLHMSADNIEKEQARKDCENKFFIKTMICSKKGL